MANVTPGVRDAMWEFFRRWVGKFDTFGEAAKGIGLQPQRIAALLRGSEGRQVTVDHIEAIARVEGMSGVDLLVDLMRISVAMTADPAMVEQNRAEARRPRCRGRRGLKGEQREAAKLSDLELEVIKCRFSEKETLQVIADRLGRTRQRIHQVEASALRKLGQQFFDGKLVDVSQQQTATSDQVCSADREVAGET
jgi:hypothetical protein